MEDALRPFNESIPGTYMISDESDHSKRLLSRLLGKNVWIRSGTPKLYHTSLGEYMGRGFQFLSISCVQCVVNKSVSENRCDLYAFVAIAVYFGRVDKLSCSQILGP
jgi:hypothetical protein